MDHRYLHLQQWLSQTVQLKDYQLEPMAGDASFRRYFRVHQTGKSHVVMDAPPLRENCTSFIAISNALRALNLRTPEIIQGDLSAGFLLLTDFGDRLLLKELNSMNAENLYSCALDALAILQNCRDVTGWTVPLFTADFMREELKLFKEWFLETHLGLILSPQIQQMLTTCFDFLAESAVAQPQVFMHRDYHSANLMILPNHDIGILDFQDAFIGPVTYDLVSLLRDCYIDWPEDLVTKLVLYYRDRLENKNNSSDEFLRWFDLMGIQRHLKALLTFSRKFRRDGNATYLQHIPRTLNYILMVSERYEECWMLNNFLKEITAEINLCVE